MATEILLPKLGFSMTDGELREWLIADGAHVQAGEPLFSIESDKSVNEVESPATGILRIIVEVGESYPVGTILATIE